MELPKRKIIRLQGYDYSTNGAYFITICVKNRQDLLGNPIVGRDALGAPFVQLSEYGTIVHNEIEETPLYYEDVSINKFIVMPNHIHMIVIINRNDSAPRASRPTTALISIIISMLKKKTDKKIGFKIWQRSYHDHIIRDEEEYQKIRHYIDTNPLKWENDRYNNNTII